MPVFRYSALLLCLLLAGSAAKLEAQRDSALLSGVVRDAQGHPQTGVLVELLSGGAQSIAITDGHGGYQFRNLLPGVYQIRASAALSMPVLRDHISLRAGTNPIINLLLIGMFDEPQWKSARRGPNTAESDDWKWTLRSPANRPLLRLASEQVTPGERRKGPGSNRVVLSAGASSGGFASSPASTSFALTHVDEEVRRAGFVEVSGGAPTSDVHGAPLDFRVGEETVASPASRRCVSVRAHTYPQVRLGDGSRASELKLASAQRMLLGDLAAVDVGSETEILSAAQTLVLSHPFLRLTSRPVHGWVTHYSFATSLDATSYDDVRQGVDGGLSGVASARGLLGESRTHNQISLSRRLGKSSVEVSYHRDHVRNGSLSGGLVHGNHASTLQAMADGAPLGTAIDTTNGALKLLAPDSASSGYDVIASVPMSEAVTMLGGYLADGAVGVLPGLPGGAERLRTVRSQAVVAVVDARLQHSGTHVTAAYRWQPGRVVGVVSPFALPETGTYLSASVHQKLPLHSRTEVFVEGQNLLGQGYRDYPLTAQDAFLASTLAQLRAGLIVTF